MENKIKKAKCDVCGNDIIIDQCGNGEQCKNCGWRQSEESFYHKDTAGILNIPSLNNAIKQYKMGKSAILSNFDDFIQAFENYGEIEFTYNNTRYGLMFDDVKNKTVLLNIKNNQKQYYDDISDFSKNAEIDGKILKTNWDKVTNTDFLQDTN